MEFRKSFGEKIDGESWVMRDIWQMTNMTYGPKFGLATSPKKLASSAIKRLIERAIWEQGLRQPLKNGQRRHKWKAAHGFRKFYKTRSEQAMRSLNVEITMGHNIGVSRSYYKPSEKEVLDNYLHAEHLLTINEDSNLSKQVQKLKEQSHENEYTFRAKMQEKDDAILVLSDQVMQLINEVDLLKQKINK